MRFGANIHTPPSGSLASLLAAAVSYHQSGALSEAERRYRHILSLFPEHAETHGRLGAVLMAQGKIQEAIAEAERAVALKPNQFEAHANLAQAYMAIGQVLPAVTAITRALELRETPQTKALFAEYARLVRFTADDNGRFRKLVHRALLEAWTCPRELVGTCISLIKLSPLVNNAVARADAAWPQRQLLNPTGLSQLSRDALLRSLLESDPVTDIGLERLLTNIRHVMVMNSAADAVCDEYLLGFYAAIARQCFINEYVFSLTDAEAEAAQRLRTSLEEALASGGACPTLWPVIVGAYIPLHRVAKAQALLERTWPPAVAALLVQQIAEPAEEHRIAATIPALTEVDDPVSRAVRDQYEENPYPRWTAAGPTRQTAAFLSPEPIRDALIAGCGTGLSTVEFARHAPQTRILAIDLSVASLSYAKRMAQKFGLATIEFAQADIMRLGDIGREFDFIDASGVLHHLADPWAGWRRLLSLLRPGGIMQVGLYSGLARQNVVAARNLIAQRGYRPTPKDIRKCREEISAAEASSLLKSLMTAEDFFTTSECRDLIFHVQEHRLTLPEIKAFITANRVEFLGFHLDVPTVQRFAGCFPERGAMTDLDRWHAFETEAPATFAGMYKFAVRKLAAPGSGVMAAR